MGGGEVGDVKAFHNGGDLCHPEGLGKFCKVLIGAYGAGELWATRAEAPCWFESFDDIVCNVSKGGCLFKVELFGCRFHFFFEFV